MKYLKFTQYAYLLAGIIFAIDGVSKLFSKDNQSAILSFAFALIGIFMFFFRRNYAKRFEERNKSSMK
jgi:uncharacterized membrane protein